MARRLSPSERSQQAPILERHVCIPPPPSVADSTQGLKELQLPALFVLRGNHVTFAVSSIQSVVLVGFLMYAHFSFA